MKKQSKSCRVICPGCNALRHVDIYSQLELQFILEIIHLLFLLLFIVFFIVGLIVAIFTAYDENSYLNENHTKYTYKANVLAQKQSPQYSLSKQVLFIDYYQRLVLLVFFTVIRKLTADVVTTDWTELEQSCKALAVDISMSELKMREATTKNPLMIQIPCKKSC